MYTYGQHTNANIASNWHQNGTNNHVKIYQCKYAFEADVTTLRFTNANNALELDRTSASIIIKASSHQIVAEIEILGCHYTAERLTTLDNEGSHHLDILMTKIGNLKPPVITHYFWWPKSTQKFWPKSTQKFWQVQFNNPPNKPSLFNWTQPKFSV